MIAAFLAGIIIGMTLVIMAAALAVAKESRHK